jgi:HEAT repeat protein
MVPALDPQAVPLLMEAYRRSTSAGARSKILESLGKQSHPELLRWLTRQLDDPRTSTRCFAIWALGELHSAKAVPALQRMLHDPEQAVRIVTVDALGKTGRDTMVALIVSTYLEAEDVQMRYVAARAMEGVGGPESGPLLLEHVREESSIDVQEALATAAGRIGGEDTIAQLIELLKNASSPVMEHIAEDGLKAGRPELVREALQPMLSEDWRLKLLATRILNALEPKP